MRWRHVVGGKAAGHFERIRISMSISIRISISISISSADHGIGDGFPPAALRKLADGA